MQAGSVVVAVNGDPVQQCIAGLHGEADRAWKVREAVLPGLVMHAAVCAPRPTP